MGFKSGKEWNGNRNGRPGNPEIQVLRAAIEKVKKKHKGKHVLEHFVERGYENDQVAIAIAKKLIPDLSSQKLDASVEVSKKVKDILDK